MSEEMSGRALQMKYNPGPTVGEARIRELERALELALFQLEAWEVQIDGEWGSCRKLAQIGKDGELSDATIAARVALGRPR